MKFLIPISGAWIWLLCSVSWAVPRIYLPTDPEAREVKAPVNALWDASLNHQTERAESLLQANPEQHKLLDAYLSYFNEVGKSAHVLGSKFKDLPQTKVSDISVRLYETRALFPVVINENRASISGGGFLFQGEQVERINGEWVIVKLSPSSARAENLQKQLELMSSDLRRLREAVEAGQVTTVSDLQSWKNSREELAKLAVDIPMESVPECNPAPAFISPLLSNAVALQKLLGISIKSPDFPNLVTQLIGLPRLNVNEHTIWLMSDECGLQFNFENNLMAAITVLGEKSLGAHAYRGELPNKLNINDTRREVETKLGPPSMSSGGIFSPYSAEYPQFGISVDYRQNDPRSGDNPIHHIFLTKPDIAAANSD